MPQANTAILQDVAANVRNARRARDWSQDRLAREADVSRRMLVAIESGETNVSLGTLCRVAVALDVPFVDLIRPPAASGEKPRPVVAWQGTHPDSRATLLETMKLDRSNAERRTIEFWEWRLAPGEHYVNEPDPAGSREILFVLSGTLTLDGGSWTRLLQAGESTLLPTDQSFAYTNAGTTLTVFIKNLLS
jgi:transcriptional regulator with XRE-family HTH domain